MVGRLGRTAPGSKSCSPRSRSWRSFTPIRVSRLMAELRERTTSSDAAGVLALVMRISQALNTRSFRQHAGDWDVHTDVDTDMPELLPPRVSVKPGRAGHILRH